MTLYGDVSGEQEFLNNKTHKILSDPRRTTNYVRDLNTSRGVIDIESFGMQL